GEKVADIPSKYLTDEAPRYERPMRAPSREVQSSKFKVQSGVDAASAPASVRAAEGDPTITDELGASVGGGVDIVSPAPPTAPSLEESARDADTVSRDFNDSLVRLLSAPNVASQARVFQQY